MSVTLISKNGNRVVGTSALASLVARRYASGKTLPEVVREIDEKTGERTIHVVAAAYWSAIAKTLGPLDPTPAAIYRARKNGERREIVAERAGVSVARVREIESTGRRSPVYVGRGTRAHVAK